MDKSQKKDFDTLTDLNNAVSSAEYNYQLLYGMRIKTAMDELINNPLNVLEVYGGKSKDIREQYKSVKQITEESNNE